MKNDNKKNIREDIKNKNLNQENFIEYIKEYRKTNKLKIYFGMPCYGGQCQIGFFKSTMNLKVWLDRFGIENNFLIMGGESLVQRARNACVAQFLDDKEATHLFFIDADITFNFLDVLRLIIREKDMICGVYPKKAYNFEKMKSEIKKDPNINNTLLNYKSLDYVFNPELSKNEDGNFFLKVKEGLMKVKETGTGFMCIRRNVFDRMIQAFPECHYINNVAGYGSGNNFYSFFDCEICPESKVYLSEDYLFCRRWSKLGGDIWVDVTVNLIHTGYQGYNGLLFYGLQNREMDKDHLIMRDYNKKNNIS